MSLLKHNLRKRKLIDYSDGENSESNSFIPPQFISSIPDQSNQLCMKCQTLNFEEVSQLRNSSLIKLPIQALDSVSSLLQSACPLCQLFGRSQPAQSEENGSAQDYKLSLEVCSSNKALTNSTIVQDDSVLLGMVKTPVRNRYILTPDSRQPSLDTTGYIALTPTIDQQPISPARVINPENVNDTVIRRWWKYCCGNHTTRCGKTAVSATKSLRVIDCVSREIVDAPPGCSYVALSYVWGDPKPDTDVKNMRSQKLGKALPTLPKTIEDSMVVVQKLGFRYLWVDRYCINQFDKDNKHQQIQQMDLIYSGAELTIIAAAGNSPEHGLPGIRGTRRSSQDILRLGTHLLIRMLPHPQQSVQNSTWATLAWTYQEAIL